MTCAQNELRRLLPLPGLNAIEHSQEQVGEENDLGRVCRIVELHLAVARGILEDPDPPANRSAVACCQRLRPRLMTRSIFELAGSTRPGRRLWEMTMPFLRLRE